MTIDQLKKLSDHAMEFGVRYLQEMGHLSMMVHLVRRAGMEVEALDTGLSKDEAAQVLRRQIAEYGDVEAVIIVSDTWYADATPADLELIQQMNLSIPEADGLGLCKMRESIIVSLESPIYRCITRQDYRRTADGGIEMTGAVKKDDDQSHHLEGRFFGFFAAERPQQ